MSHRKWRETKQQLIWWPDVALLGCCLVSSHFLRDILSGLPVNPHRHLAFSSYPSAWGRQRDCWHQTRPFFWPQSSASGPMDQRHREDAMPVEWPTRRFPSATGLRGSIPFSLFLEPLWSSYRMIFPSEQMSQPFSLRIRCWDITLLCSSFSLIPSPYSHLP